MSCAASWRRRRPPRRKLDPPVETCHTRSIRVAAKVSSMKIIICGAGQVGWQIARHLSGEQNDVTVVDNNPDLVRQATDTLDVQGIAGHASYPDVLDRAGARDADMIIAATHSDEVNMVTCQVAHSVFAVPRKIARLRAQSYLDAIYSDLYRRDHMPIDVVISPEREVAEAALRRLSTPAAFDNQTFMGGKVQLLGIGLDEDCPVLNTPLKQLTDLFSTLRSLVVGVRRGGVLFAPEPGDQLFAGDEIYVVSHRDDTDRALDIFGKAVKRQERVVILGGGNVGLAVARALEASELRIRVKMIEKNRRCAEFAADALDRTIVLNGDGMSRELLAEATIHKADSVLCVTDDDKTNLLAAVRAKQAGCGMAICLVNDPSLQTLMKPLAIDAFINPRATTVSSILRHIRHGRVRGVYSIGDAEAEVIEAQVLSTSPISGQLIREIDFPEGALVGAVEKNGKVIRPTGATRIEEGDIVVVFALAADVPAVQRLFQVSIDFF
ncbi:Trk system potassium transporter TrkA [Palleronia rufa]|uniref:Trk system potassium transporter TrkA n=1 Tax=Palleronia rufa TaxID=1530186 RepID=UPI003899597A